MPADDQATQAEVSARVDQVMQWIALGLTKKQIVQASADWQVVPRTIDKYIRRARDCFAATAEPERKELVGLTLRQLNDGIRRCIANGDEHNARGYIQDRSKLLGLNAATKTEVTGKNGGPIEFTDARSALAAALAALTDTGAAGASADEPA